MATPLYKRMKQKGTSFYAFPNAIKDFSLAYFQDNVKISPSKFILLNIPKSVSGTTNNPGVLDFIKSSSGNYGTNLYSWDPDEPRSNYKYSESLIEGIRNYIANSDTVYRESKITNKQDFYNPSEKNTPTESLFWKWCKKMNMIDLEPAVHMIDWDKHLPDFQNPNESSFVNRDYFNKYLWKEREIIEYDAQLSQGTGNKPNILISEIAKFKKNDKIFVDGGSLNSGITYKIIEVSYPSNNETKLILDYSYTDSTFYNVKIKLDYHRLVQYIGEIQAVSKVQTSVNNTTEFTAMIPSHAGKTPTILFATNQSTNYYPGLELPILPDEIKQEINGAEYLNSPIRLNPGSYPGSYYGYFDTIDKTYQNSNGDAVRLSGDYFGVLRNYNDNLFDDNYIERLTEFNSDNIDGLVIDFNRKHYLKMNLPNSTVKNFDEFNSMVINDEPPSDFEYNAILWYYDIDDGSGDIITNLYGIEFLNNPDNDFGVDNDRLIEPTRKLVTNNEQDGLSYIYNINIDFKVDNDISPLKYDPTSVYNLFGFDLYNNVMSNYGKLNRNFMTIIDKFIDLNTKLNDMESIIYSQIDLDEIKFKLDSHEKLIQLYKTNQFVESDTVGIETDYTKNYPTLKFNIKNVDYNEIYNYDTYDILQYNLLHQNSGLTDTEFESLYPNESSYVGDVRRNSSMVIDVVDDGKMLINIYHNIVSNSLQDKTMSIILSKDLNFKQSVDIIIRSNISFVLNDLQINIMYDKGDGKGNREGLLINSVDLPIDVKTYNINNPSGSTYNNSYYYESLTYIDPNQSISTGSTTQFDLVDDLFVVNDWVYIDGFNFKKSNSIIDYSGLYKIVTKNGIQVTIDFDSSNIGEYVGKSSIFYYRGIKLTILRIDNNKTTELNKRYLIRKEFLTSEYIQKINN